MIRGFQMRRGLTLVEVLCAMVIASILMAVLVQAVTLTARASGRARGNEQQQRRGAALQNILRQDLSFAFAAREERLPAFIGRGDSLLEPVMEFFTTHALSGDKDFPLRRVTYQLQRTDEQEAGYELFRSEAPYVPFETLPAAQGERLIRGVTAFEARFFDGVNWHPNWRRNSLPNLVEVVLVLEGEGTEPETMKMQFFPLCDVTADPLPRKW